MGDDVTSPPVEIEGENAIQNTVSHESADVVESISLSELVDT